MIVDLQIDEQFLLCWMRKHFLLYTNNLITNEISKIFLTVVCIVIHNYSNNGDIHRSLKYYIQNFKTSLKNIKT